MLNIYFSKLPKLIDGTTVGQVAWWDGTNWTYLETDEIFWDDVNKRFGIKTATPETELHINGQVKIEDDTFIAQNKKIYLDEY